MSTQKIQVNPHSKQSLPSMNQPLEQKLETNKEHTISIFKIRVKLQKKKKKKKTVFEDLKQNIHKVIKV